MNYDVRLYSRHELNKVLGRFSFLSDPSPIIGNACHSLIDVTLACEDAYSKLVEVVTVADVSDVDRVGNSLLQIWKLGFGHKA